MIFDIKYSFYLLGAISSFVLFFYLQKHGKVVFEVLGYINPKWKNKPWCRFFEVLIFTTLGSMLAIILIEPSNPQQAIFAGLGWTGILNGIGKREVK
jgi:hypothetical protein